MNLNEVSDEVLQAFVDGELDVRESEALVARMRDDRALAARVCSLRSLRSMVQLAYASPPKALARPPHRDGERIAKRCLLGCLMLLAGAGGWALRGMDAQNVLTPAPMPHGVQLASLAREADPNRIILHLDSGSPEKMDKILDEAERLLRAAEKQERTMQLEVLANSHGLRLLRAGISPHAERMAAMKRRHANLQWVACGQTIARFTSEGQKIELLPTTRTAPTALGEIVTRLQQGWTYVRV